MPELNYGVFDSNDVNCIFELVASKRQLSIASV